MKRILAIVAATLLAVTAHAAGDPMLEAFKAKADAEVKAHGKTLDGCLFDIVDRQPDGPGRVIAFGCPFLPYICAYVVESADAPFGISVRAIECIENPAFVEEAPKTSI